MKIVKNLALPVLAFFVMGLASCSNDDDVVKYSANALKNTELMNILKQKGYQFDKDGKLELNDLANNTTSLDLSGTKLKDLSGLDILPNLKDVKLSNNGYGPVFDFALLPAQITGVDLTGNDIYDFEGLVNVKTEENGDETVTQLHKITKLYLPQTAKFNIKDLVRFYRKKKAEIESGSIDVKMETAKGDLQKYNTIREIPDENIRANFKKYFSSIFDEDGIHIDINKRLNNNDRSNACVFNKWYGVATAETLEGVQYIVNNPYWDGKLLTVNLTNKAKLPYLRPCSGLMTLSLTDVDASEGINLEDATNMTGFLWVKVSGISEIDLSHSALFGRRAIEQEQDGPGGSSLVFVECPDLKKIALPEKSGLRSYMITFANMKSIEQVDLSKFKMISNLELGGLSANCRVTYPELTEFHTYDKKTSAVSTCKCTNDCKVKKYFHKSIQMDNENSIFLSDDDLFCL
ncbi:leucine-rich repeat domain-containing protein [Hallella colorans]|uniref:Leucine rich repeat (LRR) protein n=1 Tax=Hallella colorans TaxID=1703337 RepID=A0A2U0U7H1_9BACT|nr:leucine-rich repeat domain-containing protein [Hallella colorans]PVX53573.1 hypothetical protein C7379_11188 [Hallella colorans]